MMATGPGSMTTAAVMQIGTSPHVPFCQTLRKWHQMMKMLLLQKGEPFIWMICQVRIFLLIKGTLFWLGTSCYFFGNPRSKVAWSCLGLNPGPSDSQPCAVTICHSNPKYTFKQSLFNILYSLNLQMRFLSRSFHIWLQEPLESVFFRYASFGTSWVTTPACGHVSISITTPQGPTWQWWKLSGWNFSSWCQFRWRTLDHLIKWKECLS